MREGRRQIALGPTSDGGGGGFLGSHFSLLFSLFFRFGFGTFFGAILESFWEPSGVIFPLLFHLKNISFFLLLLGVPFGWILRVPTLEN